MSTEPALTAPWQHLERLIARDARVLVPVLGSGFVTQAAAAGASALNLERPRPVDWPALLDGVAAEFACAPHAAQRLAIPGQTTLLWDAMVTELTARHGLKGPAAHGWERKLRRSVARRLREDDSTVALARPFVEAFLGRGYADVMSFNFDNVLLPEGASPKPRVRGKSTRASLAATRGTTTLWYPHGHLVDPDSIVLGAHAYGSRIAAMQAAFDAHARRPVPRPSTNLDTWVATMLERPLLFIGLSLTREEWTLWWLLAQRARFLARRPERKRPPAFIFARQPAPSERPEALAAWDTLARTAELLGLTLLEFTDFGAGWKKLQGTLRW